jgi:hypothetical protein
MCCYRMLLPARSLSCFIAALSGSLLDHQQQLEQKKQALCFKRCCALSLEHSSFLCPQPTAA